MKSRSGTGFQRNSAADNNKFIGNSTILLFEKTDESTLIESCPYHTIKTEEEEDDDDEEEDDDDDEGEELSATEIRSLISSRKSRPLIMVGEIGRIMDSQNRENVADKNGGLKKFTDSDGGDVVGKVDKKNAALIDGDLDNETKRNKINGNENSNEKGENDIEVEKDEEEEEEEISIDEVFITLANGKSFLTKDEAKSWDYVQLLIQVIRCCFILLFATFFIVEVQQTNEHFSLTAMNSIRFVYCDFRMNYTSIMSGR